MGDSKIPPKLSAMPPHIHRNIVSSADFRTKLLLNQTNSWYRDYIKKEAVQYNYVGIVCHDEDFVLSVYTTDYNPSLLEYLDHEGGCMLKSGDHQKLVLGRSTTDAIVSDLSKILSNPMVFIDMLSFRNMAEDEERLENFIDEIEHLLTRRTQQLQVRQLKLCFENCPDNAPKILLHVAPGVLEHLDCGSESEELDLEEFAGYEQMKQLQKLEGSWKYGPLECWQHLVKFKAYGMHVDFAAIPAIIQVALDHSDRFIGYQLSTNTRDQGNLWTHLGQFFKFYGPSKEETHSQTKYIQMKNSTDILELEWFAECSGALDIKRRQRNELWVNPPPGDGPDIIVIENQTIHRPTAIHPYSSENYIPSYL